MDITKKFEMFGLKFTVVCEVPKPYSVVVVMKESHMLTFKHFVTLLGALRFAKKALKLAKAEAQERTVIRVKSGERVFVTHDVLPVTRIKVCTMYGK